jgi:pimeloyl-ACP methyl ester carboxylesterase
MSEADLVQMAKHRDRIADQLENALAPGADGWVDDDIAFTKSWGFDVGSIRVPVYLAYGRADTLVPAAHGDWLAAHIPDATVVITDAGHMGEDASVEIEMAWLAGEG